MQTNIFSHQHTLIVAVDSRHDLNPLADFIDNWPGFCVVETRWNRSAAQGSIIVESESIANQGKLQVKTLKECIMRYEQRRKTTDL